MNTSRPLTSILQEMADIQTMERGKLSIIKESASGPFYKLQARENGKNVTRYIPREQVPAVREAIAGYQHFANLTAEYAGQVITHTRVTIAAGVKKKPARRKSISLKRKNSSG